MKGERRTFSPLYFWFCRGLIAFSKARLAFWDSPSRCSNSRAPSFCRACTASCNRRYTAAHVLEDEEDLPISSSYFLISLFHNFISGKSLKVFVQQFWSFD